MNWLYEKKLKEGVSERSSGGGGGPALPPGVGGEPDAWNDLENNSFTSFSYSGINVDTSAQGDGGTTIQGAFSFLSGAAAPGDRTANNFPGGGAVSSSKKSKKEELFDKQMEAYQRERNMGIPQMQRPPPM